MLVVLVGCVFVANGASMTCRPDLFLRFQDWQNPGDYWGKAAQWRKDVCNIPYKLLGMMFVAVGLSLLGMSIRLLFTS